MILTINGDEWRVERVAWDAPALVDRTGALCVATTDPRSMTIYLADWLEGDFLARVLIHEMTHATMWSYGLVERLRRMARDGEAISLEEWVCNLVADYGLGIFDNAAKVLGPNAIDAIPPILANVLESQ